MGSKPLAVVVDDDPVYCAQCVAQLEDTGYCAKGTDDVEEALELGVGAQLVVVDNRAKGGHPDSYWRELLVPLRKQNPHALLVLVSHVDEVELLADLGQDQQDETHRLVSRDPLIAFLPKDDDVHHEQLRVLADSHRRRLEGREELSGALVRAGFEARAELLGSSLTELIEDRRLDEKHSGTYVVDTIAERYIRERVTPCMHVYDVVICTEEEGVHNALFHRIMAPSFYVFSDPFDGSTKFKEVARDAVKEDPDLTLSEFRNHPRWSAEWIGRFGPKQLGVPMVSLVLAQRHHVDFAMLINLFNDDVYVSTPTGNFAYYACPDSAMGQCADAVEEGRPLDQLEGWQRLAFDEPMGSPQPRLWLGSLKDASQHKEMRRRHARECMRSFIRDEVSDYSWDESAATRDRYENFTPGPGRILFVLDGDHRDDFREALGGLDYSAVLSMGEPLTEWIGWFAFLRHAPGWKAFCLRLPETPPCPHFMDAEGPAPLTPPEVLSIFQQGYLELGILHTAYGRSMRHYNDTVAVVHEMDPWCRMLVSEGAVEVPLFQAPQKVEVP